MKLIYETTNVSVKLNDVVDVPNLGKVTVHSVHAPRKHPGHGRVTLILPDGRTVDYSPAVIHAKWN